MTEKIVHKARGLYRWERNEGWSEDRDTDNVLCDFEEGDAIIIDPFSKLTVDGSPYLWPVYGTFREYVTDEIAKVYIPPPREDKESRTWFKGGEGEYLIHEGYLTPQ